MGTSRTAAEFASKMHALGTATERKAGEVVTEGALATKRIMLATASSRGMSPGGKIAGRRWNVRYDTRPGLHPTALVRFTGPFHLVNNPTEPHYIVAKRLGVRSSRRGRQNAAASGSFGGFGSRGGAKALTIGGSFRAYAMHPGTQGKRIFETGRRVAADRVPKIMAARQRSIWAKVG